ncbi:MAG: hydantoinase B/oxoprolinase family protein, partial [Anaerolineales bacterium]
PGSMPISTDISQEGILIPPIKLVAAGKLDETKWAKILSAVRTPEERSGDLRAQLAANRVGVSRMLALIDRYGPKLVSDAANALLEYSSRLTRELLAELPVGTYHFSDHMDDDGISAEPAMINVAISIEGESAIVDFAGTSLQRQGSINAVHAIAVSAVYYVFRCLLGSEVPNNSGSMRPIEVLTPKGSLVNALPPAAVAGGNVETSQRIVDALLGALAQVLPDRIPAASQGTMNNLTIGGWDSERDRPFAYYETIAGGAGASPGRAGADAIHTHMTNTLNTPVEALEYEYPFLVTQYAVRAGSDGAGLFPGGDGIVREIELLADAEVTILSDRRRFAPYGLAGGDEAQAGRNLLFEGEDWEELPGKVSRRLQAGNRIRIETPGGGGQGLT